MCHQLSFMTLRLTIAQRQVFFVSEENILKCYTYNAKDAEWSEADLGAVADQELHPDSGLCACSNPEGIRVYFQDPSGDLKGIARQNGTWKDLGAVPAKPGNQTPLSVSFSQSDSTLYLYYMHEEGGLHYMAMNFPDGEWKGMQP